MSTTIPTACLDVLGGFHDDDPPVLEVLDIGHHASHPLSDGLLDGGAEQLLLPQSSPALLRVLARALGLAVADHEVPALVWDTSWRQWCLVVVQDSRWWFPSAAWARSMDTAQTYIPTLDGITDPTRALAEIGVWISRTKRAAEAVNLWTEARRPQRERMQAHSNEAGLRGRDWLASGAGQAAIAHARQTADAASPSTPAEDLAAIEAHLGLEPWEVTDG